MNLRVGLANNFYLAEREKRIKEAIEEWQKAWSTVEWKVGETWGWNVHHTIPCEPLTAPPEERIQYILANKPKVEIVVRINNFRPVFSALPVEVIEKGKSFSDANLEVIEANRDHCKTCQDQEKDIWTLPSKRCDKALREFNTALDKFVRICNCYSEELDILHRFDVPNTTWNRSSIF